MEHYFADIVASAKEYLDSETEYELNEFNCAPKDLDFDE